ncbi:helix-turn-helix domain-containing protein [Paenibacillus illinoisensis]|uniref:Helix-turn-helix domain-containing protein n=1 Tax=Paenibacillus illinoisensis TaxID=59845 RepID=A0ABW8HPU9_9BACL
MLPFYEIRKDDFAIIRNARQIAFPTHMHSAIEVLYVFSGTQSVEISDVSYELQPGDAAVIFPDIIHRYVKSGQQTGNAILLIINPKVFEGMFPDFNQLQPVTPLVLKKYVHKDAVYAFRKVKKEDDYAIKLGWAHIILSHLLSHTQLEQRQRTPVLDMPQKIMEYMANHFTEPLSLDTLAAEFNVSKYYISHIFSTRIQMNFRNYLSMLRVEYAAKLIRTTNVSLTTVSSSAGFESQRTFNRVFQAMYGITPREFRNNVSTYLK